MAENILQHILDAEKNADAMLADAQIEAGEAVKGAQAAVREQERQAAVTHRELYRKIIEDKRQEVQAKLDAQTEERKEAIRNTISAAKARLPKATEMIVQEVLADGDR